MPALIVHANVISPSAVRLFPPSALRREDRLESLHVADGVFHRLWRGPATEDNIELRCRAHNAYEARLFFGTDVVREARAWWADSFRSGTSPSVLTEKVMVLVGSIRAPQDFGGFPVSTPDGVRLLPMAWARDAQRLAEEGYLVVVFLEELTTVPPTTQAAMLRLSDRERLR